MGTLYIVATPIGNLEDFSFRAVATLQAVSLVLAEDTRVTTKLLKQYDIKTPMHAYHQHSSEKATEHVIERLRGGENIALVSDAGTPGINDPGGMLIESIVRALDDVNIVPIPGPNAAITALSVAGFPADTYIYLGFVPHKKGRQTFFKELAERKETQVFYESKHRIVKTLEQMVEFLGAAGVPERPIIVARELTKQFETVYRGTAEKVLNSLKEDEVLGEFVVVVSTIK